MAEPPSTPPFPPPLMPPFTPTRGPASGQTSDPDPHGTPAPAGDAVGSAHDVLDKLDALLGRHRSPEAPTEQPLAPSGIPTLDQPVHWTSPEAIAEEIPAGRHIPTLTRTVELRDAPPPEPTTRQALREHIESLLDPTLEDRLCARAMADLDRTLIDAEHAFRHELATWREGQSALIRDEVRIAIERAVDEMMAARTRGPDNP